MFNPFVIGECRNLYSTKEYISAMNVRRFFGALFVLCEDIRNCLCLRVIMIMLRKGGTDLLEYIQEVNKDIKELGGKYLLDIQYSHNGDIIVMCELSFVSLGLMYCKKRDTFEFMFRDCTDDSTLCRMAAMANTYALTGVLLGDYTEPITINDFNRNFDDVYDLLAFMANKGYSVIDNMGYEFYDSPYCVGTTYINGVLKYKLWLK